MQKEKVNITPEELEVLADLADFLLESALRLKEKGKICKSEFPALFAGKSSMQKGQKRTSHTSPVMTAECRSLSGMSRE